MVSSPLDAVETFSTPVLGDAKEVIFFSCKTENENCSYSAAAVRNLPVVSWFSLLPPKFSEAAAAAAELL
jgi:hypothetical protein